MLTQPHINQPSVITSRLLRFGEMPLYLEHLLRLDKETREQRFDYALGEEALRLHCNQLARQGSRVLGAFVDGKMRGASEISKILHLRKSARELAFSVESPFQNLGIGTELMRKSLRLIRPATAVLYCQATNIAMMSLGEKFGARIIMKRDGVVCKISQRPDFNFLRDKRVDRWAWTSLSPTVL
jgi:GNAT superfamily N-acetyltransferase